MKNFKSNFICNTKNITCITLKLNTVIRKLWTTLDRNMYLKVENIKQTHFEHVLVDQIFSQYNAADM